MYTYVYYSKLYMYNYICRYTHICIHLYIYIYIYAEIGTLPDALTYYIRSSFALGTLSGTIRYLGIQN